MSTPDVAGPESGLLTLVEDMARHYIKEIRTVQSEGPYHLAGPSFGGTVAFEMSRQLRAAGEPHWKSDGLGQTHLTS